MNEAGSDFAICHLNEAEEEGGEGWGIRPRRAQCFKAVRPVTQVCAGERPNA